MRSHWRRAAASPCSLLGLPAKADFLELLPPETLAIFRLFADVRVALFPDHGEGGREVFGEAFRGRQMSGSTSWLEGKSIGCQFRIAIGPGRGIVYDRETLGRLRSRVKLVAKDPKGEFSGARLLPDCHEAFRTVRCGGGETCEDPEEESEDERAAEERGESACRKPGALRAVPGTRRSPPVFPFAEDEPLRSGNGSRKRRRLRSGGDCWRESSEMRETAPQGHSCRKGGDLPQNELKTAQWNDKDIVAGNPWRQRIASGPSPPCAAPCWASTRGSNLLGCGITSARASRDREDAGRSRG
jgi:hypothetical protein